MKKLLIINPGSTSTKIAVFEDDKCKWTESIGHSTEELAPFNCVYDQLVFRTELVKKTVEEHGDSMDSFAAIMSRGGNLPPVSAGAYEVTDFMTDCLQYRARDQHASNVGAGIALALAKQVGIKAYIYDAVAVDEMDEIGYEDYFYGEGVSIIEWADLIKEIIPDNAKRIEITKDLSKGLDYRRITIS